MATQPLARGRDFISKRGAAVSDVPKREADSRPAQNKAAVRKSPPVATTLREFLSIPRASANAFVRQVVNRPSLSETDLSQSLQLIREQPSTLKRGVDLARA